MIDNLDKIKHPGLRNNIIQLRNEVIEIIIKNSGFNNNSYITRNHINKRLTEYVIGVNAPISICDSYCYSCEEIVSLPRSYNAFIVEMFVDYRVTYGYEPYQELDKPIGLLFKIVESDIRDYKLNLLLS